MERVCYAKGIAGGRVSLPPSKSAAHRALICGFLTGTACEISPIDRSADMEATFHFIRAMGGQIAYDGHTAKTLPGALPKEAVCDCGESGSTLRFAIPVAAALGAACTFVGRGRLPKRPIGIYTEILRGVRCAGEGLPFSVSGRLQSGCFTLPGNISSQFITGLLLALPLLEGDSRIELSTALESESYVNLTLEVMAGFGVEARRTPQGYFVPGGQKYRGRGYRVEADWSQCAFFLSMAAFTGETVKICGLNFASRQGDKKCVELFGKMGVSVKEKDGILLACNPKANLPFHGLRGITVDASDIPDMVPALAVTAALCEGETVIRNAARLRMKESDRLQSVCEMLVNLGGIARETADGLVITGVPMLRGGLVQGCNDHRIVMAAAAASGASLGPVEVTDPRSIGKSYPGFFADFKSLGGCADVVDVG